MANINIVLFGGNLCADPELRYTPKGQAVCDLRMASNRKWKTEAGEEKEEVCFVTVVIWNKLAELCAKHLRCGSAALVEGRLRWNEWTAKDGSGVKRNGLKIEANRVTFLGGKRDDVSQEHPPHEEQKHPPVDDDQIPF